MNIDVMKTFCDLVEMGNFSKAAEANYVSQSAVSQQLAKLEKDLGIQLIMRGSGQVTTTEAGEVFYKGAKEIVYRFEQIKGEVHSAADAIRGVLRVGTIYSVGFYLLDPYVRTFLQRHPEVNLHVEYAAAHSIYAAVIGGEMDLGVVACPQRHRSIEIVPMADEELVAVVAPTHRLAKRKTIKAADLHGERFVAFGANIPTRRHIDKLLKRQKVVVEFVMEFDNIELLKRAIMVGAGLSILPKDNVEREATYGDLCYVRLDGSGQRWFRPVAIVRRRGKPPAPAERMFLGLLHTKP